MLRDDQLRIGRQAHAAAQDQPLGDVVAVQRGLAGVEVLAREAHAIGQRDLADVVHQRADAQLHQYGGRYRQLAAQHQRDDGDVERVRGVAIAVHLAQHAQAGLALDQHLVQQGARKLLRIGVGLRRIGHHLVVGAPQVATGLGELALAALGDLHLRAEREPGELASIQGLGRLFLGGRLAVLPAGDRGLDVRLLDVAALRAPRQASETQRADRLDLLGGGQLEARQRERMRHPADVQMNEHADAQGARLDRGRHSNLPLPPTSLAGGFFLSVESAKPLLDLSGQIPT